LLSQAVAIVALPRMARVQADSRAGNAMTVQACQWTTVLTMLAACATAGAAPWIVPLLFGQSYAEAAAPLIWMMPGIVALAGGRILANAITAAGKPHLNAVTAVVTLVVNVVLNVVLIPMLGLRGAALATTLAYLCDTGIKSVMYGSLSGDRWWRPFIISPAEITARLKATRPRP
jgi:O-antigen/teichoic acid export membrane protein